MKMQPGRPARLAFGAALVLLLAACGTLAAQEPAATVEEADETEGGDVQETAGEEAAAPDPSGGGSAEELGGDEEIMTEDDRPPQLRSITASWGTNWERHTVDYSEIISGGPPRDGIPSIDDPQFVSFEEAAEWLADSEPVIALEINGDARAYPLQILIWHEIVNDVVGDVPVAVTFCPLCNSAVVFDRRLDDMVLEFGTSGLLRNSDLVMYDRTTESLWQQLTGEAIVGDLVGKRLTFIPASLISFAAFREAYPDGMVLSKETGFRRAYGQNPYAGYDQSDRPFLFRGELDDRLPAMMRVVAVSLDGVDIAYPYSVLAERGVVNDTVGEREIVVFYVSGTNSALGASIIAEAEDIGATGVFDRDLDGQVLTFRVEEGRIVDEETGSVWNIAGQAVEGPLAGAQLTRIISADHFWFAWAAFRPDTLIYEPEG